MRKASIGFMISGGIFLLVLLGALSSSQVKAPAPDAAAEADVGFRKEASCPGNPGPGPISRPTDQGDIFILRSIV